MEQVKHSHDHTGRDPVFRVGESVRVVEADRRFYGVIVAVLPFGEMDYYAIVNRRSQELIVSCPHLIQRIGN